MVRIFSLLLLILGLSVTPTFAALGNMTFGDKSESLKEAGVGPVVFPHGSHEKILKCNVCHPKIFKEKRGANDMTMKKNMEGQFCGSPNCHNSKAFPLFQCARCHTKVKK